MISISTKTGDTGMTSLANGQRVAKSSPVIEILGDLDELNSWLGLLVAKLSSKFEPESAFLQKLQQDLYEISAELAQSSNSQLSKKDLTKLEATSEKLQNSMADGWHRKFLYPGGTILGGYLDLSRAVCRRAERHLWALKDQAEQPQSPQDDSFAIPPISSLIFEYLNRLSDYLYLLRCYINLQQKHSEKEFNLDE